MPKIPQAILRCSFYLYASEQDAIAGKNPGGSGFLVALSSPFADLNHHYGVTNHHVVRDGFSCIRINRAGGSYEVFEFDPSEWYFAPGGDDVAVIPLDYHRIQTLANTFVGDHLLLLDQQIQEAEIGPGDDVFMIGLFLDLEDGTSSPSCRFGNISTAPISIPTSATNRHNYHGKNYCIDMHSRTGYSGSPVFVHRTPGDDLDWIITEKKPSITTLFSLLGIHCGQFSEKMPVRKSEGKSSRREKAKEEYIEGMSGMTIVVPTQRILETLGMTKLNELRKIEADLLSKPRGRVSVFNEESAIAEINPTRGDKILEVMLNTSPKHTTKLHKKKTARR